MKKNVIKTVLSGVAFWVMLTPHANAVVMLNGAGATFPYPIYSKWFSEYNKLHPEVRINYQSIGSGGGIKQITERTVDFGATDAPMTEEQMAKLDSEIMHIPTVLGAVAVVYNLSGIGNGLKLIPEVLTKIFFGEISNWNDEELVALNPQLNLPNLAITVVHRSDGSGTTNIFTDYLSKISLKWATKVGKGTSVNWPKGLGGKGNEGVTGQIKQIPGAIGYIELAYALTNKLTSAAIRNKTGKFIEPNEEATTAAAAGSLSKIPKDFRVSITNSAGAQSYPICGFTWLLIYKNQKNVAKGKTLRRYQKHWQREKKKKLRQLKSGNKVTNIKKKRNAGDLIFKHITELFALSIAVSLGAILWQLYRSSTMSINKFGWDFLFTSTWDPVHEIFGALPFIFGTIVSSLLALIIAVPISLGIAIFLSELAPLRIRPIVSLLIELLAAIPSIVYGLWGIFVLAPVLRNVVEPFFIKYFGFIPVFRGPGSGLDMFAASLILAVMIIPTISAISREVMTAVPLSQRETALALGATQWETIRVAVLAMALPGIIGASLLGLGRALGETMAVTMVIGNRPEISLSLFQPAYTMSSVIANEFAEATSDIHLSALSEIGFILLIITLIMSIFSRLLVWSVVRKYQVK